MEGRSGLHTARGLLKRGEADRARQHLEQLLDAQGATPEGLYLLAVSERYCGRPEAAMGHLLELLEQQPDHARAHQEIGHLHLAADRNELAVGAFRRALAQNPALLASVRGQRTACEALGHRAEVGALNRYEHWLQNLPEALLTVMELLAQQRLGKAEQLCRSFLKQQPEHVEGILLLADIATRLGVLDDAEFLLESAVTFDPAHRRAQMDYVQVLRKRQKFEAAAAAAKALLATAPEDPQLRSLYAIERMQTGDYEGAIEEFDRVLEQLPGDPATLTNRGHALKTSGRTQHAIDAYRQALMHQPGYGEAYHALANLKTFRFEDQDLEAMQAQLHGAQPEFQNRVYLQFALGKAYEDRGDYDAAFACYAAGNRLKKAQSRYDADQMHAELKATAAVCTASLFTGFEGSGCDAPDPIFIVGLPRAGSTLLEQILASHSQVDGTLELPNILSLAQRLRRRPEGYPAGLATLDRAELCRFGERYLEETSVHRQGAPFFVDKMPNNFRHVGLIRLMLPQAKIIDARRNPMACCFSGFKQLFAEGQEFSYDLRDIGRYYRDYQRLMAHWDEVLPGAVLRVDHEAVVDDLEGQVRRLLAYCGLPFEDACLQFHATERSVRTPSSEQVRRPIFRDGLAQWRRFDAHLEPLRQALGL